LHTDGHTLSERDLKLCATDVEAKAWLDRAAAQRGFDKFPIEYK
jgi:hypothetical protein